MQVKDFEVLADSYVPRGERRFSSLGELAEFFRLACECAESDPGRASWVAEVASGVTAQADDLLRQDDDLDAAHYLFLQLMAELHGPLRHRQCGASRSVGG
jgi:hypothetical protein